MTNYDPMNIWSKITAVIVGIFIFLWLATCLFFCCGCMNFKAESANGDKFLYQRVAMFGKAKKVEVEQYDPNGIPWLWVVLDDPNSGVNPGGFKIKEPRTGIELSGHAE